MRQVRMLNADQVAAFAPFQARVLILLLWLGGGGVS